MRVAKEYLRKGSKIYVEGQLQTRKWTNKDGAEQYSTEVVLQGFNGNLTMLDKPAGRGEAIGGGDDYGQSSYGSSPAPQRARAVEAELDDEIPF